MKTKFSFRIHKKSKVIFCLKELIARAVNAHASLSALMMSLYSGTRGISEAEQVTMAADVKHPCVTDPAEPPPPGKIGQKIVPGGRNTFELHSQNYAHWNF